MTYYQTRDLLYKTDRRNYTEGSPGKGTFTSDPKFMAASGFPRWDPLQAWEEKRKISLPTPTTKTKDRRILEERTRSTKKGLTRYSGLEETRRRETRQLERQE